MTASPRHASVERRGILTGELLLNKLEEVNKSVKVKYLSLFSSWFMEYIKTNEFFMVKVYKCSNGIGLGNF